GIAGAQQTAFGASSLFGSAMFAQAAFWRSGGGQDLMGVTPQTYRSMKDPGEPVILADRTWRLWTSGFGGTTSFRGDAATGADLDTHASGFAVGLDYQVGPSTLAGIAGGYSNSTFSAYQLLTSGTVEGAHVGLYGVQNLGPLYFAGTAQYAHFYDDTNRLIDFVLSERAAGKFTSDDFAGRLEAGWQWCFGGYNVTPFADVDVANLSSGGFTENSTGVAGGPGLLGLTVGSNSMTSLESSAGIQVDTRIPFANGILTPFTRVAWVHEFNPDRNINASLTLSPAATFSPEAAFVGSDAAKVDAGLKFDVTGSIALFAYFDGEFSGQGKNYAGNGGFKISW
ncbi:MAG: autotransporter outer membrane beta-barrel domain-containing protein, partial [Rhodomicrobium sp.]